MANVKQLKTTLKKLCNQSITKDNILELETVLLATINTLPNNGVNLQNFITELGDNHGTTAFKALIPLNDKNEIDYARIDNELTKDVLLAKAKEIISLAKYNFDRLEALTVADSKDTTSLESYLEKVYYHQSKGKNDPAISAKIGEMKILKDKMNDKKCTLDNLREYSAEVNHHLTSFNQSFARGAKRFYVIDPLLPSDKENKEVLLALLKQEEKKVRERRGFLIDLIAGWFSPKKIIKGKSYQVELQQNGKTIKTKVRLTHDVMIDHEKYYNPLTEKNDLSPRFRVISNGEILGKGKQGTAYSTNGVIKLTPNENDLNIKLKSTVVVKEITGLRNSPTRIKNEADLLHRLIPKAKSMGSDGKTPFCNRNYIRDKRFDGDSLSTVIAQQKNSKHDVKWLTDVTLNLLGNLEHIHEIGMIHHDIWPENIKIDQQSKETRILDLGSAKNASDWLQFGGKRGHRAPEKNLFDIRKFGLSISFSFRGLVGKRSDVYMLGRSLAALWITNENVKKAAQTDEALKKLFPILDGLLNIEWGMTKKTKKAHKELEKTVNIILKEGKPLSPTADLVMIIARMLHSDKKIRPRLNDVINNIEYLRLNKNSDRVDIKDAYDLAHATRIELLNLQARSARASDLTACLHKAIDNIKNDTPEVIEEFIHTMKITAFAGLQNKAALKNKVNSIIKQFREDFAELCNLQNKVVGSLKLAQSLAPNEKADMERSLKPLLTEINRAVQKARDCSLSLDGFNELSEKWRRECTINKFKADFQNPGRIIPASVTRPCNILSRLDVKPAQAGDDLDKENIKNTVKYAIRGYLANHYSKRTKPNAERLTQMDDILRVLDNDNALKTADDLRQEVKDALGHLSFFRSSQLHNNVTLALSITEPRNN